MPFFITSNYTPVGCAQLKNIPKGFKPLFNGKDLAGWHVSCTTHQGTTPNFFVKDGVLTGMQHPFGQGGVLLRIKGIRILNCTLK